MRKHHRIALSQRKTAKGELWDNAVGSLTILDDKIAASNTTFKVKKERESLKGDSQSYVRTKAC